MNFIGGQNGTGKSAILVAVAMCLGAKSKDTARADSLKDFVGTFREKAVITVKLALRPGDPVRSEHLHNIGREVSIERTIPKSGAATYRILDERGRKVSNKRDDVDLIIDHLGLQVDNPIQVMQQTQSKTFLHSGKENKYYEFFHRATGLADLHDTIAELERTYKQIQAEFQSIQEKHASWLETDYKPAEKDYEETKYLREMKQKVDALDVELIWAYVCEAEAKLEDIRSEVLQLEDRITKGLSTYEQEKEKENQLMERLNQLKTKIEGKTETDDAKQKRKAVTLAVKQQKKLVKDQENQIASIQKDKKEIQSQIKRLERDANEAEKARAEATGRKSKSQLREHRAQLAQAEEERVQVFSDMQRLEEDKADKEQEKQMTGKNVEKARRDVDHLTDRVKSFEKSTENNLNKFGREVGKIANDVQRNARKFSKPPIGPVGSFLKLKDERWKLALADACTDKVCQTYLCYTNEDVTAIRGVFGKTFQASAQRANTDNFDSKLYGEQQTLMDIVEIDHPDATARLIIRNFLIDRVRINELRLADNYQTAVEMADPRTPPHVVTLANGVRHTASKDTYFQEALGNTCERKLTCTKTLRRNCGLRLDRDVFSKDVKAQQKAAQQHLAQAHQELVQVQEVAKAAAAEANTAFQNLYAAKRNLKAIDQKITSLRRTVQEEEDEQQQEDDDPQSQYEVEIANLQQELEGKAHEEQDLLGRLDALKVSYRAAEQEHHALEREVAQDEAEAKTYMKEYQQIKDEMTLCTSKLAMQNKKVGERSSLLEGRKAEEKKQAGELVVMRERAELMSAKPEEVRSSEEVKKEQDKLKKMVITRQREINKDPEKVLRLFNKVQHMKIAREKDSEAIKVMLLQWKKQRKKRLKAYKKRRAKVSGQVAFEFRKMLSARNYTGDLHFDHNPTTGDPILRPHVDTTGRTHLDEPPTTKKRKAGDDPDAAPISSKKAAKVSQVGKVKELSGGERSFTTLCMVLALAAQSMAPLLAMDEFDVFMDEKNRELCMTILCKEMREFKDRQLIVISPHTMGILGRTAPDIKAILMKPIERNQRVLNFAGSGAQ